MPASYAGGSKRLSQSLHTFAPSATLTPLPKTSSPDGSHLAQQSPPTPKAAICPVACDGPRTRQGSRGRYRSSPFGEFAMENAVYWNGRQVGIECAGRISWFASAPQEAIAAYGSTRTTSAVVEDSIVARNLLMTRPQDPQNFRV